MEKIDINNLNSKIYKEKKWEKFYFYDKEKFNYPESFMYDYLLQSSQDHMDNYCINYLGKRIKFSELFEKIDECMFSLISAGVKEGEIVSLCMPTCPETVVVMYALNKMGAVASFIDVRKDAEEIEFCLNNVKSKKLFLLDTAIPKVNSILEKTSIDKVIYISAFESASKILKNVARPLQYVQGKINEFINDSGYQSWKKFINNHQKISLYKKPQFVNNRTAIIQYTSGSTGRPKAVALSNNSVNDRVYQYKNNGMVYNSKDVYMDIIPIFIAFGAVVGVHLPLCLGMEDAIIPAYSDEQIIKLLKRYNPKHFTLTPQSYNFLINNPKFKKLNFSDKLTLACGGDGMNASENRIYNESLASNGCYININNGYGGSELGAPFSTERNGLHKNGSVGIPLPGNNIIIFKHNTFEPADYNEIGDICMVVNSPMVEYYNNPELTDKVKIKLSDGKTGIMLGDAGFVDDDGFLFVKGRYENVLYDNDQNEVWAVDVENIVCNLPFIKTCAIVNSNGSNDLYIVPFGNTKYNDIEIEKIIREEIKLKFPHLDLTITKLYELPKTSSGKIDRKKLKLTKVK